MIAAHAVLAPSSAPQWAYCSGSVAVNAAAPSVETIDTKEGTAAHWVVEELLKGLKAGDREAADYVGSIAPNGTVIDDVMQEAALVAYDDAAAICDEHDCHADILIEHRLHMPQIHAENWGTPDLVIPVPSKGLIYLSDYKHGRREVGPDSWQLVDYAAGLYPLFNINGMADQHITLVRKVVQPRCYSDEGPVRELRGKLSDLRGQFNQLARAAEQVFSNPTMTAGAHCRDCAGVGRCATARRAAYSYVTHANEAPHIDSMSAHDLAVERQIIEQGLPLIKGRLEAINEELERGIKKGETGSGLALTATTGRLAWTIPEAQAIAMCGQMGVDASKVAARTPTQVLSDAPKDKRDMVKQALSAVTARPISGTKLIKADKTIAANAFKRK